MNEAPIKPLDNTIETGSAELSEPHFDEIAVLIAQPVKPIAPPIYRRWLTLLEKPQTLIAIVFISAMMGITALALTLQLRTQPHTAATEIQTEQSTSASESQVVADTEQQTAQPQRSKTSKTRPRVEDEDSKSEDEDSKPKARRVGVIYGSSSDRP